MLTAKTKPVIVVVFINNGTQITAHQYFLSFALLKIPSIWKFKNEIRFKDWLKMIP